MFPLDHDSASTIGGDEKPKKANPRLLPAILLALGVVGIALKRYWDKHKPESGLCDCGSGLHTHDKKLGCASCRPWAW